MNHKIGERLAASVEFLTQWDSTPPEIGVVLGSGLGDAIPGIETMKCLPFADIPGFYSSSVRGHKSEMRCTLLQGMDKKKRVTRKVAFLRGRTHAYEGHGAQEVVHAVRSLVKWGTPLIVLTNAAGCLNPRWKPGSLMVINDHLNLTALNPLVGELPLEWGERFLDCSRIYDARCRRVISRKAKELKQKIHGGVYAGVLGPSYETPAEVKMLKKCGAHAVGMSTVLEALAAKHLGARVVGMSCLTNYAAGIKAGTLNHSDVLVTGRKAAEAFASLLLASILSFD